MYYYTMQNSMEGIGLVKIKHTFAQIRGIQIDVDT